MNKFQEKGEALGKLYHKYHSDCETITTKEHKQLADVLALIDGFARTCNFFTNSICNRATTDYIRHEDIIKARKEYGKD
jgi:predicted house-cleaning noncanonical NTP pyrophosphatase (MazG superfamily)